MPLTDAAFVAFWDLLSACHEIPWPSLVSEVAMFTIEHPLRAGVTSYVPSKQIVVTLVVVMPFYVVDTAYLS
jgi:hypothetical protein